MHDGLTLVAGVWPSRRFPSIREDIEGHFRELHEWRRAPAERLCGAQRVDKWVGTAGVANYFRKPYGPGWALVGDAGYDKDPLTAQGISDAFVDAESLSVSPLTKHGRERRSFDDSLHDHHARRDRAVKPMYDFTCQLALLEPPPPHLQEVRGLQRQSESHQRFLRGADGRGPAANLHEP